MNRSRPVGRRALVGVAIATAVVSVGATYALAAPGPATITGTGVTTQGPCKVGYDTQTATLTPPDELLAGWGEGRGLGVVPDLAGALRGDAGAGDRGRTRCGEGVGSSDGHHRGRYCDPDESATPDGP